MCQHAAQTVCVRLLDHMPASLLAHMPVCPHACLPTCLLAYVNKVLKVTLEKEKFDLDTCVSPEGQLL